MNAAPNPKDTQDFQFKYACTQHVCENLQHIPVACSLIVADNKRGLLYIAYNNKLTVLKNDGDPNNRCAIDYDVSYPISKLSLSCDFSYLGVTSNKSTAYIYNASSLSKNSLEVLHEVQLSSSSPHVYGYDLRWNPAVAGMFCTVASDHSIGCFQIKVEQKTTVKLVAWEKIAGLEAMCVAWSPKGKQLVVGCKNGNIVQLKPELKVARTIPGPSPAIGEVIAILWISNYQFCAAFSNTNDRRVNVLIVNAPKGETLANFICYEDITYGMSDMEGEYLPRYYFDHIPEWNLIIAASSSSSEVAILGSLDNGANWEQWQLIDSARAQLPLIRTTETYPIGMTIDKSSTIILPWGPENTLPNPVPILYIFGTSGQVISFHMVNLQPNCPSLCSPPTEQITLIPPPRASMLPSEISFNNHAGITSTPRPKQTEVIMEKPKTLPNVNLFNNPLTVGNMVLPTSTIPPPPPPTVAAPVAATAAATATQVMTPAFPAQVDLKIPKPRSDKIEVPPVQKTEPTRLSPVKEVSTVAPASENPIIDDSICWRAYQDEFIHFEKELKAKLEPQVWQIGTEEERQKLITQCAEIDEFWRELRETTNSLTSEIAYLKALLLQSFAWVEEAKSRNSANKSDTPRDRHDRSKIEELQRLATYTQSQLIQAVKALDMQWLEYQSQERSKMRTPKFEFIYQGLKKQSEIIASHKKIIEQLMMKLKSLIKVNKISDLNRSIAKLNLSTNTSGTSSGSNVNCGIIETRCKTIANNMKNFTREKQLILRDILLQNTPKVIKPIIPTPIQDRLEATLSSLASLRPVAASSTQKIGKLVPERSPITKTSHTTVTTTTIITPITNPTMTAVKSPLASLTSIVSNIGTPTVEATTSPLPPPQSKTQPTNFSMGAFPSFFTNTSTLEKVNTPASTQFNSKPNLINQSPLSLSSSSSSSLTTQPSTIATAFPKMMSISFGTPSQKIPEAATPANILTKETPQKNNVLANTKETGNAPQSAQPLFDTNFFATSVNTVPPTSKIDQFATQQTQPSTGLESNLILSFNNSLVQPTSNTQSVFSFASPTSTTVTPKPAVTTTNSVQTESIQTFSFASKPQSPPVFSSTNSENLSGTKPAARTNFDLSKMTVGLPSPNSTEKPPTSTVTSSSTVGTTFGDATTSIASTINFGKTSLFTPDAAQPQQENKSPIALPAETTIERVGGFTGMLSPTTSGSSIFGGNSALTTNMFKSSVFGGTSTSSALPQVSPLSATNETPTATSTASIFSNSSKNLFAQNPVTSINSPPPPTYSDSQFSNTLNDPTKSINFGKPPQAPEVSSIFGKNSASIVSSSVVTPSSPFSQTPSSPVTAANLTKSPSTTAASTNFFANTNSSNNSIFGGMTGTATASSKLFGGNSTVSTTPSSIFDGGNAATVTAAPSPFGGSIFGGSSTFGASPPMPAAAPAFGATPAFPAKPIFGGQPSIFGVAKPEFSSPFGFGGPPGFGNAPNMTASPTSLGNTQMGKVFGSSTGNSTFESLADQNNQLTFDSLAQKSPSPEKPPSFSGGSSFSSWR